jgi:hypothetical protein
MTIRIRKKFLPFRFFFVRGYAQSMVIMILRAAPAIVIQIVNTIEFIMELSVSTAEYDCNVNSTGQRKTFLAAIAIFELKETASIYTIGIRQRIDVKPIIKIIVQSKVLSVKLRFIYIPSINIE